LALVLVLSQIAVLRAVPALASDDEGEVFGVLTVNLGANSVSVNGTVMTVDAETRLRIEDDVVTLAELDTYVTAHPTAVAEAEYRVDGDQKIAQKVKVEEDDGGGGDDEDELEIEGSLAVDVPNSRVTVAGVELTVTDATDIEAGDAHTTLTGLADYLAANPTVNGEAKYQIVDGARIATKVETKGDHSEDGDDDDEDEQELVGVLSANAGARTVSVGDVVFQTTVGTEIKINRVRITLAALVAHLMDNPGTVGKVEYRLLDGQLVAREVKVLGAGLPLTEAEATGVVTDVDAEAGTIQFLTDGGSALVLTLDAATEIQVDAANVSSTELAGLLDPALEIRGRVHYNPDTLLLREIEVTVPVVQQAARIAGVNVRTHVVTLKVQDTGLAAGRVRKVRATVLPGATIIRGRKILRLRDLRGGQRVTIATFSNGVNQISPEIIVR